MAIRRIHPQILVLELGENLKRLTSKAPEAPKTLQDFGFSCLAP